MVVCFSVAPSLHSAHSLPVPPLIDYSPASPPPSLPSLSHIAVRLGAVVSIRASNASPCHSPTPLLILRLLPAPVFMTPQIQIAIACIPLRMHPLLIVSSPPVITITTPGWACCSWSPRRHPSVPRHAARCPSALRRRPGACTRCHRRALLILADAASCCAGAWRRVRARPRQPTAVHTCSGGDGGSDRVG